MRDIEFWGYAYDMQPQSPPQSPDTWNVELPQVSIELDVCVCLSVCVLPCLIKRWLIDYESNREFLALVR